MPYGRFDKLKPAAQINSGDPGYPFGDVLGWLKGGLKATRRGWNGQGMFIYLVPERDMCVGDTDETEKLIGIRPQGLPVTMSARIDMQYANGKIGIWSPSHEDLLAGDWNILR